MQATRLLKHNIETLLKARGQTQHDLAQWCRRTDAWLSKILSESPENNQSRSVPLKYYDRIADFFGIATYQLFQPGISPLTERRGGRERRTGLDRRVSHAQEGLRPPRQPEFETVTPGERALLTRIRRLTAEDRKLVELSIDRFLLLPTGVHTAGGDTGQTDAAPGPIEAAPHIRKQRKA